MSRRVNVQRARKAAAAGGGGLAARQLRRQRGAANGARSRDAGSPRPHACLQIIIIGPVVPVAPPLHRGRYALRATHRTAVAAFGGIRFGIFAQSFDLFT